MCKCVENFRFLLGEVQKRKGKHLDNMILHKLFALFWNKKYFCKVKCWMTKFYFFRKKKKFKSTVYKITTLFRNKHNTYHVKYIISPHRKNIELVNTPVFQEDLNQAVGMLVRNNYKLVDFLKIDILKWNEMLVPFDIFSMFSNMPVDYTINHL